jgi:hypothetical protein
MSSVFSVNLPLIYMLPILLGAILLDLVLAVGVAFKTKTFSLNVLPQFLQTQVLTYYLPIVFLVTLAQVNWAYFAVSGVALGFTTIGLVTAAWGAIGFYALKILFVNITANFSILFGITISVEEEKPAAKNNAGFARLSVMLAVALVCVIYLFIYLL